MTIRLLRTLETCPQGKKQLPPELLQGIRPPPLRWPVQQQPPQHQQPSTLVVTAAPAARQASGPGQPDDSRAANAQAMSSAPFPSPQVTLVQEQTSDRSLASSARRLLDQQGFEGFATAAVLLQAAAQVAPARETGPLYTLASSTRAANPQYPQMPQVQSP